MIIKMVQILITYKNEDFDFLESIHFNKTQEVLTFIYRNLDDDGTVQKDIYELCTSNKQIIKLRDFLNNLKLCGE